MIKEIEPERLQNIYGSDLSSSWGVSNFVAADIDKRPVVEFVQDSIRNLRAGIGHTVNEAGLAVNNAGHRYDKLIASIDHRHPGSGPVVRQLARRGGMLALSSLAFGLIADLSDGALDGNFSTDDHTVHAQGESNFPDCTDSQPAQSDVNNQIWEGMCNEPGIGVRPYYGDGDPNTNPVISATLVPPESISTAIPDYGMPQNSPANDTFLQDAQPDPTPTWPFPASEGTISAPDNLSLGEKATVGWYHLLGLIAIGTGTLTAGKFFIDRISGGLNAWQYRNDLKEANRQQTISDLSTEDRLREAQAEKDHKAETADRKRIQDELTAQVRAQNARIEAEKERIKYEARIKEEEERRRRVNEEARAYRQTHSGGEGKTRWSSGDSNTMGDWGEDSSWYERFSRMLSTLRGRGRYNEDSDAVRVDPNRVLGECLSDLGLDPGRVYSEGEIDKQVRKLIKQANKAHGDPNSTDYQEAQRRITHAADIYKKIEFGSRFTNRRNPWEPHE